ncbi:MAG: molybdopterin-dependent oxidoreductase [bacterium]
MEIVTSCTCDCPDTCSILATTSNGGVTGIRGNPDFAPTAGFLCRKSRGFLKRLASPDRLLHPLARRGSGWKRISWTEAADLAAREIDRALREFGPLSIFFFQDGGSIAALKLVNRRFFNLLGGATFSSGSLCGGAGIAAQTHDFGSRTSHDPCDLLNSKLILVWGRNPAWTNVHLVPVLRQARRKGALVVLVDPVETATRRFADLHMAPRPGTDAMLALAMAKAVLEAGRVDQQAIARRSENHDRFCDLARGVSLQAASEETGLGVGQIDRLGRLYAGLAPAAIVAGWGVQRRRNGADIYRFLDALGMISGNVGRPGGGVSHGMDETRWFGRDACLSGLAKQHRSIPRPQTGRGLFEAQDPPVRVAVVSGANPANQCPDIGLVRRGLQSVGFKIVLDMFMTETASLADLVLPTTHFLQERDLVGSYWHNYVMPVNVAQARLGEEKTDLEVFSLLAARIGVGKDFPADPDFYLQSLAAPLAAQGLDLAELMQGPVRPPGAVDVPFAGWEFPTPSSRFRFVERRALGSGADAEYPLALVSPHPQDRVHSQVWGGLAAQLPAAWVSREAASEAGLAEGDAVVVETRRGRLECMTRVSAAVPSGSVVIYEGWPDSLGGTVNRLTSDEVSDQGFSATYNDVACRLRKAGGCRVDRRGSLV